MIAATDKLDDLLAFDPLATAEELTGKKHNEETLSLGLALTLRQEALKKKWLKFRDDVYSSMGLKEYCRIIEANGFEMVLKDSIPIEGGEDFYFIYAHRNGLVLEFDTYWGASKTMALGINGGNFYYNWLPNPGLSVKERYGCTSSGCYVSYEGDYDLHVGYTDCREALIHKIMKFGIYGQFLPKWHKAPWMRFCSYQDWRNCERADRSTDMAKIDAIHKERFGRLPDWVQEMIGSPDEQV